MRAVKMFVAGLVAGMVGLAGIVAIGTPAQAAKGPNPDEVKTVTMQLRVERRTYEKPIPEGTAYYCAVGAFVSFNDLDGWTPVSVTAMYLGDDFTQFIGEPPYDDNLLFNNMRFQPEGAKHHRLLGDLTYGQGGSPGDRCQAAEVQTNERYADTATVRYVHTDLCKKKIRKYLKAKDNVKKAQRRADNTTGRAHAQAVQALNNAKAALRKAKKKYKQACF